MEKLENLSAASLGKEVNSGRISPTQVIEYFAHRIEERNKSINAFVYTKIDDALSRAKKIEEKLAKSENCGEFTGVPTALKDFLPSKRGWTNSHGGVKSLIREDSYDSAFYAAMRKAGAIALGKTNAPAFAFRGTTDNYLYGATSTPFNTAHNSGGSSGGSAAAVADGLISIAEGSDGGGSIRIPAAWCSCFGFKASVGTIPSVCRPDAWAATHPYCFNGAITRTVEDSAIALNYMAQYNPRDPLSLPRSNIDYREEMQKGIKGWKIAFTNDFDVFNIDKEICEVVEKAALKFQEAGATVEKVHFNFKHSAEEMGHLWCRSISIDTAIELELMKRGGFDLREEAKDEIPAEFFEWQDKAFASTVMDYYDFNLIRTEILDAQEDIFENYDLIVSPTTCCLPVLNATDHNTQGPETINGKKIDRLIGFAETFFENFTGNPAASVPCGLSKSLLPIGMQIIGKKFRDADVFRASRAFELLSPWDYTIPFNRKI